MSYENFSLAPAHALLKQLFPPSLNLESSTHPTQRKITLSPTPKSIIPCLHLLKLTIGPLYASRKGPGWVESKAEEMLEDDLVYVSYSDPATKAVLAFISFILTLDDCDGMVLYLYEIHVHPELHGLGVGTELITGFHRLAECLRHGEVELDDADATEIRNTKLTVFPENRAMKWYESLGYRVSVDSPRERKMRSGKVVKPEYYLLVRPVV